jgi:hypothetical protein
VTANTVGRWHWRAQGSGINPAVDEGSFKITDSEVI